MSPGSIPRMARVDSLTQARAFDATHALIAEEIPWARAVGDSLYLAVLLLRQGHMWAAFGLAQQAQPPLTEAMALCNAMADTFHSHQCLRWLAVTSSHLGRDDEAREYWVESMDRALATDNREVEGGVLIGLAYYDQMHGNPTGAVDRYHRAIDLLAQWGTPAAENFAINGLGTALHSLGEYDEALECYYRSAEIGRRLDDPYVTALAENNIGSLQLSLGDPGEALRHLEASVAIQRADGAHRAHILPSANIALAELGLGRHREAIERLNGLLAECEEGGYDDLQYEVLGNLTVARMEVGQPGLAEQIGRRLLAEIPPNQHDKRLLALTGLIYALREQEEFEQAVALCQEWDEWSRQLQNPRSKVEFDLEYGRVLIGLGRLEEAADRLSRADSLAVDLELTQYSLLVLPALASVRQQQDRPVAALDLLTRAIALWEADRLVPLDPEWREQRGAGARSIGSDLALLQWRHDAGVPEGEWAAAAFATIQTVKARTLLERIGGPGDRWQRLQSGGPPLTLDEFQNRVLQEGELFLDFLLGPHSSLLLAVTRRECRLVELPSDEELEPRLQIFRDLLSTPPTTDVRGGSEDIGFLMDSAARLRRQLLAGVEDLLKTSRGLIVSPDGALNLVPFALLLEEDFAVTDERQWQQVPSAAFLNELRTRPQARSRQSSRILALAGPSVGADAPLSGAQAEVRHLARRYRDVTRTLPALTADPDSVAKGLAEFEILHFATHSTADDQSPWNSAISLESPDTTGQLFSLSARRIADLSLPARLVVLSSCQSAAGRALSGEGIQGLASAFLSAGAPAVVASLWPVDDIATSRLMEVFYAELSRGGTAAAALGTARRRLADSAETSHPFFWAGFLVIGAGDEVLTLRPQLRSRVGLFVGCTALALSLALLWRRPKRGDLRSW